MSKLPVSLQAKRDEWIKKNSDFEDWLKDNYFATHAYNQAFKDIMESPELKDLAEEVEVLLKKQALMIFAEEPEHLDHLLKDLTKALATYKAWVGNE